MTLDKFDAQRWVAGMLGDYGGVIYSIISVNFPERLIGLKNPLDDNEMTWVRCENVILQPSEPAAHPFGHGGGE